MPARRSSALFFVISLVALGQASEPYAAPPTVPIPNPLPVEQALAARDFADLTPLALSPNGAWAAYTVSEQQRPDRQTRNGRFASTGVPWQLDHAEIRLTNTTAGTSAKVGGRSYSAWSAAWSPDGRSFAFYSDRAGKVQLWIKNVVTGLSRPASDVAMGPLWAFEVPQWTADGRHILVKVAPQDAAPSEDRPRINTPLHARARARPAGPSVRVFLGTATEEVADAVPDTDCGDLALINIASGRLKRITPCVTTWAYWISPDSEHVAYTRVVHPDVNSRRNLFDIVVIDTLAGSSRVVASATDMQWGTEVSWSPDSKNLSFISGQRSFGAPASRTPGECYVVSISTALIQQATNALHPDFGDATSAPLWDSAGNYLYLLTSDAIWQIRIATGATVRVPGPQNTTLLWVASSAEHRLVTGNTNAALVLARNELTKTEGFYSLDLVSQVTTRLTDDAQAIGAISAAVYKIASTTDGKHLVYVAESAQRPRALWRLDVDTATRQLLANINPALDKYLFGQSRLLSYETSDAKPLQGALLLPATYKQGTRYPLIVFLYGGAFLSNRLNQFGLGESGIDNMQLFSTRGYAVLFVDTALNVGTPMRDIAKSILPALSTVVSVGIADPDRIGVMGHSYGGYSVLALLVQTQRFAAAVARAAQGDLVSTYGQMADDGLPRWTGWAEDGQGRMGGTPWQVRNTYIGNSPVFFLDNVQTPLLLIQGGADTAVPPASAEEIFVGLRRLGKDVVYAKYPGEGHYEGGWSYANRIDYFERITRWFDLHLKDSALGDAPRRPVQ